jgi:hypothetical protein
MSEMEMVRTLAELIAFGTAIVVPILKLNSNIVKLTDAVNGLKEANGKLEKSNTEEHKQLHERINHRKRENEELSDRMTDHENRISILENK